MLVRLGVAAAAVAGLAVLAVPVVRGSDLADTATRTSATPQPLGGFPLPGTLPRPPHARPRPRRWHAGGIPPGGGSAVQSDTVVVATVHRLEGRDPVTGTTRWYYERRNATLCSWTTQDRLVFAAFRKAHGCRDLVALNAGT